MKKFYIPYDEKADINYPYLIQFYLSANYSKSRKSFDEITYTTLDNLTQQLNAHINDKSKYISKATVSRILNNQNYDAYLQINKQEKTIIIKNQIKNNNKFIVLNSIEANLIVQSRDNLLAKYILYLKYYCGYSSSKKIDTTAKQFLEACGYSTRSNSYISKLSEYNNLLVSNNIITIEKYRDNNGHERNIYCCK